MKADTTVRLPDVLARAEAAIKNCNLEVRNSGRYNSTPFCEVAEYRYFLQMIGEDASWQSIEACDRMLLKLEALQANPWARNNRGDCARTHLDALSSLMHESGYTRRYVHMRRVKETEVDRGP